MEPLEVVLELIPPVGLAEGDMELVYSVPIEQRMRRGDETG